MKKTDTSRKLLHFFYKKKKAMSTGFLVTMVITIIAFMFIAGTIFRFMSKAEDKQAEVLCRDSVALKAAATINIGGVKAKVAPVLCKTLDKKITGNREEIKKEIADKMARCWWMFNEGRYDVNVFDNLNIFGGKNKCFVCYTMLVEESRNFEKDHTGITPGEFGDFISKTKYKNYNGTYLDYIQFASGPGAISGVLGEEGIKPGRAYGIAYKGKADKCKDCGAYAAIGIVGGTALSIGLVTVVSGGVALAAIPLVLKAGAITGGVLTTGGVTGYQFLMEKFVYETELDMIIFSDISNEKLYEQFANTCTLVEDIAGN